MTKNIAVLGSTGSIGTQTLEVARKHNIKVSALAANSNAELLYMQAMEFHPDIIAVRVPEAAEKLRQMLAGTPVKVVSGIEGLCEAAVVTKADTVLTAVVGMVGLLPTLDAINAGKKIALANKETLVAGGDIVMRAAREKNVPILPVDSEHSAIFQSLAGCTDKKQISKILLTASGGPFFGKTAEQLSEIGPKQALKHPNWEMGAKITIDSATLVNKGLEFIEAMHLFDVTPEQIEIVVHRESIIHSMVEFVDSSVIAQLSVPDMRLPIMYALSYPERLSGDLQKIDFSRLATLSFAKPDTETFCGLFALTEAAKIGGTMPAALNAANEALVSLFLKNKIGFLEIGKTLVKILREHKSDKNFDLKTVLQVDKEIREKIYRDLGEDA